jgi:hypothetical protein
LAGVALISAVFASSRAGAFADCERGPVECQKKEGPRFKRPSISIGVFEMSDSDPRHSLARFAITEETEPCEG